MTLIEIRPAASLNVAHCLALAALSLASPAAFAAEKVSFQGLDGSSTRQDVLKSFPHAKSGSVCGAGVSVRRWAGGEDSCSYLSVDNYVVDNRAYNIFFNFSPDEKLKSVSLSWRFGSAPFEGLKPLPKYQLYSQFESAFKLLNYKYGDPLKEMGLQSQHLSDCVVNNGGDMGWSYDLCDEWQSGPSEKYEAGQDHIILKLSAHTEDSAVQVDRQTSEDELYQGEVSVEYKFVDSKAADKL
jgi:hypothetical protein